MGRNKNENRQVGEVSAKRIRSRTHCKNGHRFDMKNTRLNSLGHRVQSMPSYMVANWNLKKQKGRRAGG
jgi:hypothetical protein